jgi:leucyl aminopeptidase
MPSIIVKNTQKNSSPAGDAKDKNQAFVLFCHSSDGTWVVPGLKKDTLSTLKDQVGDQFSFEDLKKGLFYRGLNFEGRRHLMLLGVEGSTTEDLRKALAALLQTAKAQKVATLAINLESFGGPAKKIQGLCQAAAEGALLADYKFDQYLSKPKEKKDKPSFPSAIVLEIPAKASEADAKKGVQAGQTLAECMNFSRRLGDTPGNLMTPSDLADAAVKAAKGTGLRVTVWDKAQIKKEKMGGLIGVNLGGGPDCRFIILEYKGAGAKKQPVAFVGKGLTFDSGGISIKPSGGMEEMKYDMCGGANVIGTLLAIAKLKLKVNAIGLIPTTENMPGPMANKPGDILVARNGKTVEVFNTDAEGRLILMDALVYACEQKPSAVFDAATLTGAIVVSLGNSYTGVFTKNDKLMNDIQHAANAADEWVWPMPINEHHLADMKGTHADLCNISSFKGGGSSTAAAFLEQFVEKDIPWAHFDIAGTAWNIGNRWNYHPKRGASGIMIRTFVELAKKYGA